jgi:hypothetical protein
MEWIGASGCGACLSAPITRAPRRRAIRAAALPTTAPAADQQHDFVCSKACRFDAAPGGHVIDPTDAASSKLRPSGFQRRLATGTAISSAFAFVVSRSW